MPTNEPVILGEMVLMPKDATYAQYQIAQGALMDINWDAVDCFVGRYQALIRVAGRPAPDSTDTDALVKRLDLALNGTGAAKGPTLADVVNQVEHLRRTTNVPLLAAMRYSLKPSAPAVALNDLERVCGSTARGGIGVWLDRSGWRVSVDNQRDYSAGTLPTVLALARQGECK